MYYGLKNPSRKQEFINRMNQQIKVNENLIQGLETCEPFVRAFNGKVANSKLIKAIYTAENPNKLSYSITERRGSKGIAIDISDYRYRAYASVDGKTWNYLTSYSCVFPLPTTKPNENSQNRVNADEAVMQMEEEKQCLLKSIEDCKTDMRMYDEEITAWEELERQVQAYENKFSPNLRGDITMSIR